MARVFVRQIPKPDWTIYDMATKSIPIGWLDVFPSCSVEIKLISDIVQGRRDRGIRVVPDIVHVFRAFELTPLNEVRVIIIGMDPYPTIRGDGQSRARGLSFSIDRGDQVPVSLKNIYKALQHNYPDYRMPTHGDLSYWAKQGVLMLNASLTTDVGVPGAHGQIWFPFLRRIFDAIKLANPNFIVLLWGKDAQKLASFIGAKDTHTLLGPHPAARDNSFRECPHFRNTNFLLEADGFEPIDWQI